MKRKEDRELSKHTLNLFKGQMEKLQQLHPRIGGGKAIRHILAKYIEDVEARAATLVPEPAIDAQVEDL